MRTASEAKFIGRAAKTLSFVDVQMEFMASSQQTHFFTLWAELRSPSPPFESHKQVALNLISSTPRKFNQTVFLSDIVPGFRSWLTAFISSIALSSAKA
jgi:hypothetical protein